MVYLNLISRLERVVCICINYCAFTFLGGCSWQVSKLKSLVGTTISGYLKSKTNASVFHSLYSLLILYLLLSYSAVLGNVYRFKSLNLQSDDQSPRYLGRLLYVAKL